MMKRVEVAPAYKPKVLTMKAVCKKASQLRSLIADDVWVEDKQSIDRARSLASGLAMDIAGFSRRPRNGRLTLTYRLARAEADRLLVSCDVFAYECKGPMPLTEESKREHSHRGTVLFSQLGVFLAMAEGL